jgi:hypothetical protein
MKYNRQNRTENPLEVGGGGGDEAAWGELGGGGGDLGVGEGEGGEGGGGGVQGSLRLPEGGFRAASVARVPHPELVPGGPRVSGEAGGVPRSEVPGVGGVLGRLPEAFWWKVGVDPHNYVGAATRV